MRTPEEIARRQRYTIRRAMGLSLEASEQEVAAAAGQGISGPVVIASPLFAEPMPVPLTEGKDE